MYSVRVPVGSCLVRGMRPCRVRCYVVRVGKKDGLAKSRRKRSDAGAVQGPVPGSYQSSRCAGLDLRGRQLSVHATQNAPNTRACPLLNLCHGHLVRYMLSHRVLPGAVVTSQRQRVCVAEVRYSLAASKDPCDEAKPLAGTLASGLPDTLGAVAGSSRMARPGGDAPPSSVHFWVASSSSGLGMKYGYGVP